jgi:uncharacterized protein YrzB (UPF0473 family)
MDELSIIITTEAGEELEMEIVFTYEDPDSHKNYVFYLDPHVDDGEVFVSQYDANGNLIPIEEDGEWATLERIFEDYVFSQEDQAKS